MMKVLFAMVKVVVLLSLGMATERCAAQCNIVLISVGVQEDCSNVPFAGASWSGGTPPFNVSFQTLSGWGGGQSGIGAQSWSGNLFTQTGESQAICSVTDAMGCSASTTVYWQDYFPMPPQVTLTYDCSSGGVLRWTGMYSTGISTAEVSPCPGPFYYNLHNSTTGASWNDYMSADWVQESPTVWRYADPLPAGYYSVDIFPSSGYTCNAMGQIQCYPPSTFFVPADPGDCGTNFNLRAGLAGALPVGTLMGDQLRTSGLVPTLEPYSALGYTYVGTTPGASLTPSLLTVTGNNAIVDWVVVELRSPANPGTVLYSRPALLQRDGDLVGLNGSTYINTPLAAGSYHVALRHRNHLGIMTASPRSLGLDPASTMIDFRLSSTLVYGANARTAVGTVQCLWPGDCAADGVIRYVGANNDRDPMLMAIGGSTPTNVTSNVYSALDANMDGSIRYMGANNDRDIILQTIGGSVPTATRIQQLP